MCILTSHEPRCLRAQVCEPPLAEPFLADDCMNELFNRYRLRNPKQPTRDTNVLHLARQKHRLVHRAVERQEHLEQRAVPVLPPLPRGRGSLLSGTHARGWSRADIQF
ncbi:unannotated protein [freshwater metagenome]|uniref:Unannotated protein n=1 Tax=freshwater metagenome TaxID=449393 RepID=A0A6J7HCE4_9ZZZZ